MRLRRLPAHLLSAANHFLIIHQPKINPISKTIFTPNTIVATPKKFLFYPYACASRFSTSILAPLFLTLPPNFPQRPSAMLLSYASVSSSSLRYPNFVLFTGCIYHPSTRLVTVGWRLFFVVVWHSGYNYRRFRFGDDDSDERACGRSISSFPGLDTLERFACDFSDSMNAQTPRSTTCRTTASVGHHGVPRAPVRCCL